MNINQIRALISQLLDNLEPSLADTNQVQTFKTEIQKQIQNPTSESPKELAKSFFNLILATNPESQAAKNLLSAKLLQTQNPNFFRKDEEATQLIELFNDVIKRFQPTINNKPLFTKELTVINDVNQNANDFENEVISMLMDLIIDQETKRNGFQGFPLRSGNRKPQKEEPTLSNATKALIEKAKEVIANPHVNQAFKEKIQDILTKLESDSPLMAMGLPTAENEQKWLKTAVKLPWQNKRAVENFDLKTAQQILDESHYGMEKVKHQVLLYLALRKRIEEPNAINSNISSSNQTTNKVLCLVGQPGVGKTTIAASMAKAMNRPFFKIALGGASDEAAIRGHDTTYVGSHCGRIIKAMIDGGVTNPVICLDEIDKVDQQSRGSGTADALLELLDPSQTKKFVDKYIGEDYDLSNVTFIATANYPDQIPNALADRMDVLNIPSYQLESKVQIAKNYIIPKILSDYHLENLSLPQWTDEDLAFLINNYTREAGVRELTRKIVDIYLNVNYFLFENKALPKTFSQSFISELLGEPKVYDTEKCVGESRVGVVNGMAYSTVGGSLLPIEVLLVPAITSAPSITITGNLKETMQESAKVALSYVKANATKFGINPEVLSKNDIHIHAPAGGVSKDGPSAGVTIATALISVLTGKAVPDTISMTGEITLTTVKPIGGVVEKVLAAYESGVKDIFLPYANEKDLADIKPIKDKNGKLQDIKKLINFHLVKNYDDIANVLFADTKKQHIVKTPSKDINM